MAMTPHYSIEDILLFMADLILSQQLEKFIERKLKDLSSESIEGDKEKELYRLLEVQKKQINWTNKCSIKLQTAIGVYRTDKESGAGQ